MTGFLHLENSSLFKSYEKKNTTAGANQQMVHSETGLIDKSIPDAASQDDMLSQFSKKEDEEEANKVMEDIAAVILNQRKINFSDDLGQASTIREVSS